MAAEVSKLHIYERLTATGGQDGMKKKERESNYLLKRYVIKHIIKITNDKRPLFLGLMKVKKTILMKHFLKKLAHRYFDTVAHIYE